MRRSARVGLSLAITALALAFYQLPNLLSIGSRLGLQLADPGTVGLNVQMQPPWYPIASTQSALGKLFYENPKHPVVMYHKPAVLLPWEGRLVSIVRRPLPTAKEEISAERTFGWGTGHVLRSDLFPNTTRYVVAPVGLQVLVLTDDISYLDEIQVLRVR
jgi:hypothetical protein